MLRPQVAISVDSAQRSWIARIFSGQPGFDPYSASVSDVYHDLHGAASFTGKGIYDVSAFDAAVGERFPENAILSHDLIEGEHARTGLIQRGTGGRLSRHLRRVFQAQTPLGSRRLAIASLVVPRILPCLAAARRRIRCRLLSRWKIVDNLRRSLLEISLLCLLLAGWFAPGTRPVGRWLCCCCCRFPPTRTC